MKPRSLILIISTVTIVIGLLFWFNRNSETESIHDFASCKAAGYPIAESYPEQCIGPDQTFTNPDQILQTIPAE